MPAAAVIPAPIAYIKVAAVKKLVVGSRVRRGGPVHAGLLPLAVLTSGSCSLVLVEQCPTRLGCP